MAVITSGCAPCQAEKVAEWVSMQNGAWSFFASPLLVRAVYPPVFAYSCSRDSP